MLICSDGLSNEVETDEMATVLRTVPDPQEAAQQLVDVANEHGGADNITVVIVDVQVGEEGGASASKVTPLTVGAATTASAATTNAALSAAQPASGDEVTHGPPGAGPNGSLAWAPSAATTLRPDLRQDDTLAPGAQLSFGDQPMTLADSGPRSDEFLLGAATSVPVARATARVPPPPVQRVPEKESRGARRRRLGVPRRITPRVIGFILLMAAVPVAAYFVLRWYAYDNFVVTVQGNQVVVKQGQPGGVLWFHPKIVDQTGYTMNQLEPSAVAPVKAGVQEPSLDAAKGYVNMITASTTTTTVTTTTTTPLRGSNPAPPVVSTTTTAPTRAP